MDYWDYRKIVSKIIPRRTRLSMGRRDKYKMKEKGRKSNYRQFDILAGKMEKIERLLSKESIQSFAEVSLRAQSCPMPFNIDVWDGIRCPYACKYCYADYFKHSLYTSFFDNSKSIGLRHCDPDFFKRELGKLFKFRGEKVKGESAVANAIRLEIPLRLGIRFEDFPPVEERKEISLRLLKYLSENSYPVMVNTKSDLIGRDKYVEALSSNAGKAAVHITLISSDLDFCKKLEPGAPSPRRRLIAAKNLSEAGVRVVARIEPWMIFLNDEKNKVDEYIDMIKEAGIRYITFDSYSYSANSKGIADNFYKMGIDFERMFLLSADSQWLSSFLLGKFMDYFRRKGISVSTFDQGNVPDNDDAICCSVGNWFEKGFNWGCGVIAIRFIRDRGKNFPVRWSDFVSFVEKKGGFLSSALKDQVRHLWNGEGDSAWPIYWGRGMEAVGSDKDGIVWKFDFEYDFRKYFLENGGLI